MLGLVGLGFASYRWPSLRLAFFGAVAALVVGNEIGDYRAEKKSLGVARGPVYSPSHEILRDGRIRFVLSNPRQQPNSAVCVIRKGTNPDTAIAVGGVPMRPTWTAHDPPPEFEIEYPTEFGQGAPKLIPGETYTARWSLAMPQMVRDVDVIYEFVYGKARGFWPFRRRQGSPKSVESQAHE